MYAAKKGCYSNPQEQWRNDARRTLYVETPPIKRLTSGFSQDAGDQESGQDKKEVNVHPPRIKAAGMHEENHEDRNPPNPMKTVDVVRRVTKRTNRGCHCFPPEEGLIRRCER
jgi:hypothetical protein